MNRSFRSSTDGPIRPSGTPAGVFPGGLMIIAVVPSSQGEWVQRVRGILAQHASVLDIHSQAVLDGLLGNLRVDLVLLEAEYLTEEVMTTLHQVRSAYPDSMTVCVATEEAAERARVEASLTPDFWIVVPATELQLRTQIEAILALATTRISQLGTGRNDGLADGSLAVPLTRDPAHSALARSGSRSLMGSGWGLASHPDSALYRMVGRMTGSVSVEHLLVAYCDAIHELTQCVSYCLLWQDLGERDFRVARAEGLPPVLHGMLRLGRQDPLPSWLHRHRGILTRDMIADGPETAPLLRELDLCGGVLALPLFSQGVLRGVMVVGPKALGDPYLPSEAEALFVLSANAAAGVRQIELHQELEERNNYIDQVLSTMESGVVTIGVNSLIRVCNAYAARVLRMNPQTVIGQDVRALPAPLGDYLYACLTHGEERTHEELSVLGGEATLRVSTRRLTSPYFGTIGSMLLVEDTTAERALAEQRRREERREVINQVVARFAHELKNPLATIQVFAELLPTRLDDPDFQSFWADHVRRDIHRLDDLVTKLVSLAETPESFRTPVSVRELVQLACERVEMLEAGGCDRIQCDISDDLPPVRVDANVMARALAHLLRQGLAAGTGTARVEAALQEGPEGERPVAIFVRVPQPAPAAEDPHRLLDLSFVLDHPDVDLGPSASQRLVESQGGALDAFNEGRETVFRISLIPESSVTAGAPQPVREERQRR